MPGSEVVWRYLPGGRVQHALRAGHSQQAVAFCGRSPMWYAPADQRWQDDEEGLAARRPCSLCLNASQRSRLEVA